VFGFDENSSRSCECHFPSGKIVHRLSVLTMKANPIPSNYPQLCASITTRDTLSAIEFYKQAFGAKVRMCLKEPGGKVGHAELEIGSGLLMMADKYEGFNNTPDDTGGKSTVVLHLYVEDVDATLDRAVAAGAKLTMPAKDQFYGDRTGRIVDPFGHVWAIATHIADVTVEEMEKQMSASS
jgi:PhnB protein